MRIDDWPYSFPKVELRESTETNPCRHIYHMNNVVSWTCNRLKGHEGLHFTDIWIDHDMVWTDHNEFVEPQCECWKFDTQVCDICQGVVDMRMPMMWVPADLIERLRDVLDWRDHAGGMGSIAETARLVVNAAEPVAAEDTSDQTMKQACQRIDDFNAGMKACLDLLEYGQKNA